MPVLLFGLYWRLVARLNGRVTSILKPRTPPDPHIDTLQRVRAWLGIALLATVVGNGNKDMAVPNGGVTFDSMATGAFAAPFIKAAIALPCLVVGVSVLAVSRPAGTRIAVARAAFTPVGAALALVLSPVLPALGLAYLARTSPDPSGVDLTLLVVGALALPLLAWSSWRALTLGVRYTFRAGDAHPVLPAVVGLAVAAISAALETSQLRDAPPGLATRLSLLNIGGAFVVGALSLYEIKRLHRLGVRWAPPPPASTGPWPPPDPPSSPAWSGRRAWVVRGLSAALVALFVAPIALAVNGALRHRLVAPSTYAPQGTFTTSVPLGAFRVPAKVTRIQSNARGIRVVVTFTNRTSRPLPATTCAVLGSGVPALAVGTHVVRSTDGYCMRHPRRRVIVPAHRSVLLWAQFPLDPWIGNAFTLRWPSANGRTYTALLHLPPT